MRNVLPYRVLLILVALFAVQRSTYAQDIDEAEPISQVGYEITDFDYPEEQFSYGDVDLSVTPYTFDTEYGRFIYEPSDPFIIVGGGYTYTTEGIFNTVADVSGDFEVRMFAPRIKGIQMGVPVHVGFVGSYRHSVWSMNNVEGVRALDGQVFRIDSMTTDLFGVGAEFRWFCPPFDSGSRLMCDLSVEYAGGVGTPQPTALAGTSGVQQYAIGAGVDPGSIRGMYGPRLNGSLGLVMPSGVTFSVTYGYAYLRTKLITGSVGSNGFVYGLFSVEAPTDVIMAKLADLFD